MNARQERRLRLAGDPEPGTSPGSARPPILSAPDPITLYGTLLGPPQACNTGDTRILTFELATNPCGHPGAATLFCSMGTAAPAAADELLETFPAGTHVEATGCLQQFGEAVLFCVITLTVTRPRLLLLDGDPCHEVPDRPASTDRTNASQSGGPQTLRPADNPPGPA
jgi:hypothetical protein